MRRVSLLQRFAAVSLVLVVLLGVLMSQLLARQISHRALESATEAAQLMSSVAIQPLLRPEDLVRELPPDRAAALDEAVARFSGGTEVARIKVWHHDGDLLYVADPHTELPAAARRAEGGSHAMEHAREGEVEAEIISSSPEPDNAALLERYGTLLEVYVPIVYPGDPEPAGVFELYLPYEPVQDSIRADTTRAVALLALGLVVLWLGLFRVVATASRRLRRQAESNEHLALFDALTDLPNRAQLQQRIEDALADHGDSATSVGLVVLDLDRFREVNDTLGHRHGDALIREVAVRLAAQADGALVARLGGDEFAVLLTDVADEAAAIATAEHLRAALHAPVEVDGVSLVVDVTAGVSLHPQDAADASAMLQHADVAMYVAKSSHRGVSLYDPAADENSPARLRLLAELARGIRHDELVLHYQPKCDLTGAVRGVEALVRWQHPERGLLLPAEFVPVAERTGLIHPLTDFVIDRAVGQAAAWSAAGRPVAVAVNVSTRSLLDPGFAERVLAILAAHRTPAQLLGLEITETTIMEDPDRALAVLTRLAGEGVRLSIDDFGTGYSSLAYLKSLPVHELKIDRSFVAGMVGNPRDQVIVDSTVALGRRLGLEVVAEGVEDEATRAALEGLGCELAQGYLFSRPVPAADVPSGRTLVPSPSA
ncbi:MAG TPA: bifunctional diguanylate cyclase/phosphodiesterase [Actinomycetes bacterium]|nr:bifunctional diguanylate cyclase/phosphodiesterase [Actinomycetes bacterium]